MLLSQQVKSMLINQKIGDLPRHFKEEKKSLDELNISTWYKLKDLTNQEIELILKNGFSSRINLEKLRNIALLIYELNIPQHEASILIHSGISTIEASKVVNLCYQKEDFIQNWEVPRDTKVYINIMNWI